MPSCGTFAGHGDTGCPSVPVVAGGVVAEGG